MYPGAMFVVYTTASMRRTRSFVYLHRRDRASGVGLALWLNVAVGDKERFVTDLRCVAATNS